MHSPFSDFWSAAVPQHSGRGPRVLLPVRIQTACLARLQRAFGDGHQDPAGGPADSRAARVPRLVDQLTSRELEVLAMLAAGRSNQGIASQLVISERTVNTHIGNIYRKLHVNNRVDAVREAMRIRLVEPPR